MSAPALSSSAQSATPDLVFARGNARREEAVSPNLLGVAESDSPWRTRRVPKESEAPGLGVETRGDEVRRVDPPQRQPLSDFAHHDRGALLLVMAALERLERADVAGARTLLDKAPLHVLADAAVAEMRQAVVAAASIEARLSEARRATTTGQAYIAFEHAVRIAESRSTSALQALFLAYVTDPSAQFKDTLLSCVADREVRLDYEPAVRSLVALLGTQDRELARSAALALDAGGEGASTALIAALKTLPDDRRRDLNRLIWFTGGR